MNLRVRLGAMCVACLTVTSSSLADDTPRTHDGLFLSVAPGIFGAAITRENPPNRYGYGAEGFTLTAGGTFASGLVIAGELLQFSLDGARGERGGTFGKNAFYSSTQAAVLFYPWPREGFHVEAGAGLATLDFGKHGDESKAPSADGTAAHFGFGQSGWIGDAWSLGGRVRLDVAKVEDPKDEEHVGFRGTMWIPSVAAVLTFH